MLRPKSNSGKPTTTYHIYKGGNQVILSFHHHHHHTSNFKDSKKMKEPSKQMLGGR